VLILLVAAIVIPLGLDLYMPVPEENPITVDKVELGRRLFKDRRLSRDGRIACASCHDPRRAFSTPQPQAVGVFGRRGRRNAPALINRGYGRAFFWDGRVPTLEEQVLKPIQDPNEMDLTLDEAAARVNLDVNTISYALASYVRSILSGDAPFDRFINGNRRALSGEQQQGLQIFRGKGNCTACHVGPTFSDERLHNTGVAWQALSTLQPAQARPELRRGSARSTGAVGAEPSQTLIEPSPSSGPGSPTPTGTFTDPGRFELTSRPADRGAFKTPTLREVARTAPYMHDGSLPTLEAVVTFYSDGGRRNPNLDPEIRPLRLTMGEKRALVAFLKSLSGTVREGL
jgi:cytochrome c peroxidase